MSAVLAVLGVLAAILVGVFAIVYLVVPIFKGLGWVLAQAGRFLLNTVTDIARLVGSVLTGLVYIPMVMGTLVIGRWSSSSHYGRAIQDEFLAGGKSIYRLFIGNPLRLFGMGGVMEGVEKRVPAVLAAAPGADRPPARAGQFEGYKIVGSLPTGGSGAKLYIAEPDDLKRAALARGGLVDIGQVVIKSFSLKDGSTLPQIVRESRSLDAAKRLLLILDYELAPERFYYVMRYVPGENLSLVTRRLHAQSEATGLSSQALKAALSYTYDLVRTLDLYHRGGLWHKDVKPDNIIIDSRDGRAHLVDFGLVSSLRSAMTLTTHGTEYFRDPEMVRMALRGVKVQDVDGSKFDLYGTGAVLYSLVEDSFPAHGVLSQFSKRVPEAVKWVIRRAMTDYDKRYANAAELLADLATVLQSADPFSLRPIDLPSMAGGPFAPPPLPSFAPAPNAAPIGAPIGTPVLAGAVAAAAMAGVGAVETPSGRFFPKLRVRNWWTGEFVQEGVAPVGASPHDPASRWVGQAAARGTAAAETAARVAAEAVNRAFGKPYANPHAKADAIPPVVAPDAPTPDVPTPLAPPPAPRMRRSAAAQLESARNRVEAARSRAGTRASNRVASRRANTKPFKAGVNAGMVFAIVAFFSGGALLASYIMDGRNADAGEWSESSDPIIYGGVGPRDEAAVFEDDPSEIARIHTASATPEVSFGRVLIVNDLPQPIDPAAAAKIADLTANLAAQGVGVVDNDQTVNSLAALRFAVGKLPIDAAAAGDAIHTWLNTNRGEADGVLWLARSEGPESDFDVYAFVRSDTVESPRLDRVQSAVSRAATAR